MTLLIVRVGLVLMLTCPLHYTSSAQTEGRGHVSTIVFQSEAENGILSGTTAEASYGCANASGSGFVKLGSESSNMLAFDNIEVQKSDVYELEIDYFSNSSNSLEVLVNDSSFIIEFPPANWCYQGPTQKLSVQVPLVVGINVLRLSPTEGAVSPFIDKLTINEAELPSIEMFPRWVRLHAGDSLVLTFRTNSVVLNEQSFDLKILGLEAGSFRLQPTALKIPAGQREISATFFSTSSTTGVGTIQLTNMSEGLNSGSIASAPVFVVSEPGAFYVSQYGSDSSSGLSPESPLKSLDWLSDLRFIPGDSILFKSGEVFKGQLRVSCSGTAEKPIVYASYGNGAKPMIDGASSGGGAYGSAVLIRNQEGIVLEGLAITNDRRLSRQGERDQDGFGIFVHNDGDEIMRNFRFRDLTIKDVFAISTNGLDFDALTVAGIYLRSEKNSTRGKEKHIRDVIVENCYITHTGKFGIWSQHAGGDPGVGNDSLNRNMDFIFRNNHTFETGGSGITPGRTYNCLVEGNTFEYPGSDVDSRMAARGSGAWFFGCRNVVAQYNKSLHIRGPKDSYGMHIDFGNKYVILQYNYSEDSEGGFVEILGNNTYATYRYNVSVNDGLREDARTFWVSPYAGQNSIAADSNYIYNNSIYLGDNLDTDIFLQGANTFIFNNILYAASGAEIGQKTTFKQMTGQVYVEANLYHGRIADGLTGKDNQAIFKNPGYTEPGALDAKGYHLIKGSPAENKSVNAYGEPVFPMAGKGIFENITEKVSFDYFGNPVNLSNPTNRGAFNGEGAAYVMNLASLEHPLHIYPNPVIDQCQVVHTGSPIFDIEVYDSTGKRVMAPFNQHTSTLDCSGMMPGHYIVRAITISGRITTQRLIKVGSANAE